MWRLHCYGEISLCHNVDEFLQRTSNNKKYCYEELEQGRQDIDNYIVKFNKLKCFI